MTKLTNIIQHWRNICEGTAQGHQPTPGQVNQVREAIPTNDNGEAAGEWLCNEVSWKSWWMQAVSRLENLREQNTKGKS